MAVRQIQSTFSYGELDELLYGKVDFDGYFKGARKLRNLLCLPQGGVKRRFGLTYSHIVKDLQDNVAVTNVDEVNFCIFEYSPTKSFLVAAIPYDRDGSGAGPGVEFVVYLNDTYMPATPKYTTDYTISEISELNFLVAHDRVIILHKDHQPKELIRGASDTDWILQDIPFNYYPTFDFSTIDGTSYLGTTFTLGATTGSGISLSASAAAFTAGHVGGLFYGAGGVARITAVGGTTAATVDIITDFDSTSVSGRLALLQEAAWGDYTGGTPAGKNRGWPSLGTFFQFRLVLANSASLTNLVWASESGVFYNFDTSEGLATYAFDIGLGSNGNEEVQALVGSKSLVALCYSGIYATSLFVDTVITPSNAFMIEQTNDTAARLDAQIVDNQIFFVNENLQKVNAANYDISTSSFNVTDASILSPHLINNPQSVTSYAPDNNDGTFYIITNEDGTSAIFQSLFSQTVQAWTLIDTRGTLEKVAARKNLGYYLVKRQVGTGATVNGFATNVYTANEDFDAFVDITAAAAATGPGNDVGIFTNNLDYLLIGNDMPFFNLAFTLNTPANVSLAPTFEYLDNTKGWTSFSPTDGTSGFTGAGTISWSLDADTAAWVPQDLESITKIALPADSVGNPKRKFWMRIRRNKLGPIDIGFTVDPSFTNFVNITPSLVDAATNANIFTQQNEYLLFGHSEAFGILNVTLNTVASADVLPTFEYLDTTGSWQTFVPTADGTSGFTGNGAITWTAASLTNWGAMAVNGNPDKYWIRIKRTEATVGTTPIESTIYLDVTTTPIEDTIKINTATRLYMERIDYDEYTDSSIIRSSNAAGLVTGLGHLQGQQVYVRVNGKPEGPYFVDASGEITIKELNATSAHIGINYRPSMIPMPLVAEGAFAQTVYQPKHLKTIYVDYYKSLGITINGQEIPTLTLNNFVLDQTPIPATGVYEITPMRGWDSRGENEISQELPLPMTIRAIGYRLEIS